MHDNFLALEHFQFACESFLQFDEVVDLLESAQFKARIHDFLDIIDLYEMTRSGKFDILDLLFRKTISNAIGFNESFFLLWGQFSTLVDEETKFPDALLFSIVLCNLLNVDMKAHEFCETLLTNQSLSL